MNNESVQKMYRGEHAIVIGGGFAGLLAGRVLADFFKKVTIIERDSLIETSRFTPRKGVPQGWQFHQLKNIGATILVDLFPKLEETLIENGAHKVNLANEWRIFNFGLKPKFDAEKISYLQTRPLLEGTIRSLLKDYPNVFILYDSEAQGLLANFKEARITGVRIANKAKEEELNLYGDLIVDASGRNTLAPEWLGAIGFQKPTMSEVPVDVCYATRLYRISETFNPGWKLMVIGKKPPNNKSAVMSVIEDGIEGKQWMVTLFGIHGDYPPTTAEGFLEFVHQLIIPELYEIIKQATPLTPITSFKFPIMGRYRYERLTKLPIGFIAVGDAFCSLNPLNAQGLTVCSQSIDVLNKILSEAKQNYLKEVKSNYFKRAATFLDNPWTILTAQEYLMRRKQGKPPFFGANFLNWYVKKAFEASNGDPKVWQKVFEVINLERPLKAIFQLGILFPVLFRIIRGK